MKNRKILSNSMKNDCFTNSSGRKTNILQFQLLTCEDLMRYIVMSRKTMTIFVFQAPDQIRIHSLSGLFSRCF